MKKICALILAMFLVLGTVPSAAFAAEGDSPKICAIIDKTSVQPGETVSVTYMLPNAVNNVNEITVALHYDTSLFKYEGVNYSDSTFFKSPTISNYVSVDTFSIREEDPSDDGITVNAGKLCEITFTAIGSIGEAQFYTTQSTSGYDINSLIMIDWEDYTTKNGGFDHGINDPLNVAIKPSGATVVSTGYTVSMGADQQVAAGQQVRIPVTVASSEKNITGFNAYDMTFTYDPTALTLNTKTGNAANLTVEDNDGTVRVRRYGATQALGEALALEFTAKATASSTVKLTSAKFDLDANSINFDAPETTITDTDTVVDANNFTVTLPDEFTSDAETRLVPGGGSFTFKPVDSHYTYTFTVKMGDTDKEGLTFGADDTYTIENISGNVVVTCTNKTPKQYDVTYKIDTDVEQDVTRGPEKATYLKDYSFTVTPRAGITYDVSYSTPSTAGTTKILIPTVNDNGTITYTVPANRVVEDLRIYVRSSATEGIPVVITGNGAEDAASGNASSMGRNMPYYFTLNQRENCDYTVTAYYQPLNTPTASKRPATVRSLGNGKYVVEAVDYNVYLRSADHWNLVVNVEKVSHSAEEVTVSKYLELNDKTMMLITVKGTPEGGKAFTYDGNTMYKVNAYGTDQYAWLVIVDRGQTLTQEEAAAKVAISAADNVVTITPSFDVNMSGKVDVNDAQLVYDMYNGTYSDFTQVSVEKFLRADVNGTKTVDHTDAVAIVNQFK
jgi:hypothetical protein